MNPANSRLMKCIERLSCGRLLEVTPVNKIKDIDLGVIPEYWAERLFEIVKSFAQFTFTEMSYDTITIHLMFQFKSNLLKLQCRPIATVTKSISHLFNRQINVRYLLIKMVYI